MALRGKVVLFPPIVHTGHRHPSRRCNTCLWPVSFSPGPLLEAKATALRTFRLSDPVPAPAGDRWLGEMKLLKEASARAFVDGRYVPWGVLLFRSTNRKAAGHDPELLIADPCVRPLLRPRLLTKRASELHQSAAKTLLCRLSTRAVTVLGIVLHRCLCLQPSSRHHRDIVTSSAALQTSPFTHFCPAVPHFLALSRMARAI